MVLLSSSVAFLLMGIITQQRGTSMNIVDKHTERERLSRAGEINDVFKHPSPSPQRGMRICSPFCKEKRGERKKHLNVYKVSKHGWTKTNNGRWHGEETTKNLHFYQPPLNANPPPTLMIAFSIGNPPPLLALSRAEHQISACALINIHVLLSECQTAGETMLCTSNGSIYSDLPLTLSSPPQCHKSGGVL